MPCVSIAEKESLKQLTLNKYMMPSHDRGLSSINLLQQPKKT